MPAPDDIKIYDTMADFYESVGGVMEQEEEFTVHRLETLHGDVPTQSPLFRANYYSIVMIRQGRGRYHIDGHTYATGPGTLYFTNPGHIKGFEIYEPSFGYVITFAESFLKQYVHEAILDEFPFLIAEVVPPQTLNPSEFRPFDDLGSQLLLEFERAMVRSCVRAEKIMAYPESNYQIRFTLNNEEIRRGREYRSSPSPS